MLVRALRLWDKDVKLTAAQLRLQRPMIGRLRYEDSQYAGRDGRGPRKCLLMPADPNNTTPLCELFSARVKNDEKGIRVRGEEDEWRRKERSTYHQVLWCVPVGDGELQPQPKHPHDVEDETAALRGAMTVPDYSRAGKLASA
jgi:hypothetical protein